MDIKHVKKISKNTWKLLGIIDDNVRYICIQCKQSVQNDSSEKKQSCSLPAMDVCIDVSHDKKDTAVGDELTATLRKDIGKHV